MFKREFHLPPAGSETFFLWGPRQAGKTTLLRACHPEGLRQLVKDHPDARRRCVACLEPQPRRTEDGIDILPAAEFVRRLWAGELFG